MVALEFGQHLAGLFWTNRRPPDANVLKDFHEDTTQTAHYQGAELGVVFHPDEHLDTALVDHLFDQNAVYLSPWVPFFRSVYYLFAHLGQLGRIPDIYSYSADVGFVRNVGGDHLRNDRIVQSVLHPI